MELPTCDASYLYVLPARSKPQNGNFTQFYHRGARYPHLQGQCRLTYFQFSLADFISDSSVVGPAVSTDALRKTFTFQAMSCMLSAVRYLHRNCVRHGDLKPANWLFKRCIPGVLMFH